MVHPVDHNCAFFLSHWTVDDCGRHNFWPNSNFCKLIRWRNLFDSNWETLITLKALRLYSLTKTAGLIIWNSLGFFLKLGQPFFIFSTVFNLALYIDIGEDVFGIFGRFNTFFGGICALMIYTSVFPEICKKSTLRQQSSVRFSIYFPAFDHWCVTVVLEILLRVAQHS